MNVKYIYCFLLNIISNAAYIATGHAGEAMEKVGRACVLHKKCSRRSYLRIKMSKLFTFDLRWGRKFFLENNFSHLKHGLFKIILILGLPFDSNLKQLKIFCCVEIKLRLHKNYV